MLADQSHHIQETLGKFIVFYADDSIANFTLQFKNNLSSLSNVIRYNLISTIQFNGQISLMKSAHSASKPRKQSNSLAHKQHQYSTKNTQLPQNFTSECDFSQTSIDQHFTSKDHHPSGIMVFASLNELTSGMCTKRTNQPDQIIKMGSQFCSRKKGLKQSELNKENEGVINTNKRKTIKIQSHKQAKIRTLKSQLDEKVMKECTFHPKVNKPTKSKDKCRKTLSISEKSTSQKKTSELNPDKFEKRDRFRSNKNLQPQNNNEGSQNNVNKKANRSSQFIQNQRQHLEKIARKKEEMRKEIQKIAKQEQSFTPSINKTGRPKKNAVPAHERLYQLKDKKILQEFLGSKTPANHTQRMSHSPLGPTTSKSKEKNVKEWRGNHLYKDAMRRSIVQKKMNDNSTDAEKHSFKNKIEEHKVDSNIDKFVIQKFIREYCLALDQACLTLQKTETLQNYINKSNEGGSVSETFGSGNQSSSWCSKPKENKLLEQDIHNKVICYEKYMEILKKMNFLGYSIKEAHERAYKERALSFQGYQMIENKFSRVTITYLAGFLLAVIGVYKKNNHNDNILFSQKEGTQIHKYFIDLYHNRLHFHKENPKTLVPQSKPHTRSQSKLREHTKVLAEKYRERVLEKTHQKLKDHEIDIPQILPDQLTHQDFLGILQLFHTLETETKRVELMQQKQRECTFHPQTNVGTESPRLSTSRSIGNQKSAQLYQNAKKKHHEQKMPEIIPQQQVKETKKKGKKIKITKNKRAQTGTNLDKGTLNKTWNFGKDTDKAVIRMREGFKQREEKQKYLQRGELPSPNRKDPNRKLKISANNFECNGKANHTNSQSKEQTRRMPIETTKKSQASNQQGNNNCGNSRITYCANGQQYSMENFFSLNQFHEEFQIKEPESSHNWEIGKNSDESPQKNAREDPFLIIDINMGYASNKSDSSEQSSEPQIVQLFFYEGDEANIGEIVDQFCMKHQLDEQNKEYLLLMVEKQMSSLLNNYGIQSTLEDH